MMELKQSRVVSEVLSSIDDLEEFGGVQNLADYVLQLTAIKVELEKRIATAITNAMADDKRD